MTAMMLYVVASQSTIIYIHYTSQSDYKRLHVRHPSYFHDFRKILGSRIINVNQGQVDSGQILENR